MEPTFFYAAAASLLISLWAGWHLVLGNRRIGHLKDIAPATAGDLPRVSVIVAARNEQRDIEQALRSLLGQDYPDLEILVVNDRSTDHTGPILNRLAEEHPRLQVIHLEELPPAWLGKNYALYCGAQRATGPLLLFTDADVVMERSAVARAAGCLLERRLDHLPIAPELRAPGVALETVVVTFIMFFCLYLRPWQADNPGSKAYVGIGAFNLIRAAAYRAIGSHQAIAMRPDDDIKLGKLVKKHGFRQQMLFGSGTMHVRWYASLWELISGLMKNAFAAVEYSVLAVVGVTGVMLGMIVWPFAAVFFTTGWTQWLYATAAVLWLIGYWTTAGQIHARRWYAPGFPLAASLLVYIQWQAMLLTLLRRGIRWRGTYYPLAELKANKV